MDELVNINGVLYCANHPDDIICECGCHCVSIEDFQSHYNVHNRTHRQPTPFLYWLGREMDEFMTVQKMWTITSSVLDAYHEMYLIANKDTCANSPCIECIKKKTIRTMSEKNYMRYKIAQGVYYPDSPRTLNKADEQLIL